MVVYSVIRVVIYLCPLYWVAPTIDSYGEGGVMAAKCVVCDTDLHCKVEDCEHGESVSWYCPECVIETLRAEVERLTNKLNTDSQNFEIIALRETERVLRAEVERYRKITEDGRIYFQNTEEVIARVEDVEGMAKVLSGGKGKWELTGTQNQEWYLNDARALSAWLKEGK